MDILRQTVCMVVNLTMVDYGFSLQLHDDESVVRLNDDSSLFHMLGPWLSMFVVGPIVILFVVFLFVFEPFHHENTPI